MNVDLARVNKMLEWLKSMIFLDATSANAKTRSVKRGQVYYCNLGYGVGSEMQKNRPAVIVQNNQSNRRSGNTIVVPITNDTSVLSCLVPITTQHNANGDVILDGQANTSNVMCVSKARLGDYICTIPSSEMREIDAALARSVNLMRHYTDMKSKYDRQVQYTETVKRARNDAQDELSAIREELDIPANESVLDAIRRLKESAANHRVEQE